VEIETASSFVPKTKAAFLQSKAKGGITVARDIDDPMVRVAKAAMSSSGVRCSITQPHHGTTSPGRLPNRKRTASKYRFRRNEKLAAARFTSSFAMMLRILVRSDEVQNSSGVQIFAQTSVCTFARSFLSGMSQFSMLGSMPAPRTSSKQENN